MKKQEDTASLQNLVRDRIQGSLDAKQRLLLDRSFQELTVQVALRMVGCLRAGGKVFFFGNGGSAADAQHLAAEFTGRYLKERAPLSAMALGMNPSCLTATGNDHGFDLAFARELQALGKPGDIAMGISTSGNSRNVIRALEVAKSKSIYTVALTGASGGLLRNIADCTIHIPSEETPRIQECHMLTGHIISEMVEQMMCGDASGARLLQETQASHGPRESRRHGLKYKLVRLKPKRQARKPKAKPTRSGAII